ncbi:MAG: hypothetical protein R6X22_10575 [Gemmatimonadota bacterium]
MRRIGRPAALFAALLAVPACSGGSGDAEGWSGAERSAAEALEARAAVLLPEIETLAGLPARAPIATGLRSREELEAYLAAELERQLPAGKAAAVVRVYARLGLVPADLDLAPLLRALLLEQVVGYYDPARDTLYVVSGVDSALVELVLAHEMVHALQDQYQDLDSLMRANLDRNDRATAAQAALEGHATLAMLEWQLARLTGGTFDWEDLPDLSSLADGELVEAAGLEMPELAAAPRVVRESLLFPYVGGLLYARARNRAVGGRSAPLGAAMPTSTEQVLHPERSFGEDRDEPTPLQLDAPPPGGWREVRADGLGELEVRIWLEELLGDRDRAARAAGGWDGDRYRLLEGPGGEALLWVTAWDTEEDAAEFAAAARDALARRYGDGPRGDGGKRRSLTVRPGDLDGVPIVTVLDAPEGAPAAALSAAARAARVSSGQDASGSEPGP